MKSPVNNDVLDLSLAQKEIKLRETNGTITTCILMELEGEQLESYMEENRDKMITEIKNGKLEVVGVKSYKGIYMSLLKRSLHHADGSMYTEDEIKKFPGRVQQKLFKEAQLLSPMTDEAVEQLGN